MPQDKVISVVFASDNVTAMPLAAAIASILLRKGPKSRLDLHVLACGISRKSRRHIESVVARLGAEQATLSWHEINGSYLRQLNRFYIRSTRPYPPASYARLLMGRILPKNLGRVIYMDTDTMTRTDLAALWEMDFGGAVALVVRDLPHDSGQAARLCETLSAEDREHYGVTRDMMYFQSGVMCIDLSRFRNGVDQEVWELMERYPQFTFPDQDALNAVLSRLHQLVDPRWNQMTAIYWYSDAASSPYDRNAYTSLLEAPYIVHFSGRPKPWEEGCRHPFANEWLAAHQQTYWAARRGTWFTKALERVPRVRRVLTKKLRRAIGAY